MSGGSHRALDLWRFLRRNALLILFAIILCGLVGVLFSRVFAPDPLYRTTVTLAFEPRGQETTGPYLGLAPLDPDLIEDQIPLLLSRDILEHAATEAGCRRPAVAPSKDSRFTPDFTPPDLETVRSRIDVRRGPLSNTLVVRVTERDPRCARAMANTIGSTFAASHRTARADWESRVLAPLEERIERTRRDLQDARADWEAFLRGNSTDEGRAPGRGDAEARALTYTLLRDRIGDLQETARRLQEKHTTLLKAPLYAWEVRTLGPAMLPESPLNPPRGLLFGIGGALIGLVLGLLGALLRGGEDGALRDVNEVEKALGLPVLGVIPLGRGAGLSVPGAGGGPKARTRRVTLSWPGAPMSESIQALRARLFSGDGASARVLLLTSARRGEGRTLAAANLALASARFGMKTLLVDADVRRPALAWTFGLEEAPGLVEALSEGGSLGDLVKGLSGAVEGSAPPGAGPLHVLTSGRTPPAVPAGLFRPEALAPILEEAKEAYDVVILDGPPLDHWADVALLGRAVDGLLILYRMPGAATMALKRGCDALADSGCRLLGIVLNGVPPKGVWPPPRPVARPGIRSSKILHGLLALFFLAAGLLWYSGGFTPVTPKRPSPVPTAPPSPTAPPQKPPEEALREPARPPEEAAGPSIFLPPPPTAPQEPPSQPLEGEGDGETEADLGPAKNRAQPEAPEAEAPEAVVPEAVVPEPAEPEAVVPEVVEPDAVEPGVMEPAPDPFLPPTYPYSLYLGSYRTQKRAMAAVDYYRTNGLAIYWCRVSLRDKGEWYRVFAGYFRERREAAAVMKRLGFKEAEVKRTSFANLIGTYGDLPEMEKQEEALKRAGYAPYHIPDTGGRTRLLVGAYHTRGGAATQNRKLKGDGFDARIVER